ncbi:MAG TPA: hypothetical protein PKA12_14565 [Saprospiraceae bacterium]|nr:hypothetical protein [Saprospiraceae bacterium]
MSKIKPHQDNIELMFPDEVYLRGEELFEDGAVLEFTPIEKNLFSFVVSDGQRFEVEWLRPFTKHQRASCDCSFFKAEKVCRHVVAAILAYKATLPEKKEKPAESQQKSGLNLFTLLNNVTKEELKAFIKNYAQTDKKLSTALKVHFARKVDLHDNEKKYRSILDAIIRPVTTGSATIKISDVKSLNQVAIEFVEQAWDAIALGQYGEALILTKVTLSKLCYTLHHNNGAISVLEKNITICHEILERIGLKSPSIEVKENVVAFLKELANFSYYPYLDLRKNAIMVLLHLKKAPVEAHDIIASQLWRKREDVNQLVVLSALSVIVGYRMGNSLSMDGRLLHLTEKTANLLLQEQFYPEVDAFCQSANKSHKDLPLIHIKALHQYKPKTVIQEAANYFLQFKDLRIVDWLRETVDATQFDKFRSIIEKKSKEVKSDPYFYCLYLFRSRQDEPLMEWLKSQRDFRMVMMMDEYLYPRFPEELTRLYEMMSEDFLNQHIGRHAYVFMDELLQHLNKIKAGKIANKIALLIEMKFPHRSRMSDLV